MAQFNWATLRFDANDPRVGDFVNNVSRINALADRMPGFVWRHQNDSRALTKLKRELPFDRTKRFTTTLSVWRDFESLETFVFKTVHNRYLNKRAQWFLPPQNSYMALWWVPEDCRPTIEDAVTRADELLSNGESERVFGWPNRHKEAENVLSREVVST